MSKFKKGVLDKDTMSILSNGRRAHTNNDETNRKIKAEIITMNVGEYIEFEKKYLNAVREFSSRHRHKNPEKKFAVYKQGMSEARIARLK